ncbi:hypothetical protein ACHQM5_018420 [Ranunculus cassubicifolius]
MSRCPFHNCFDDWVSQQRKDLVELLNAKKEEDQDEEKFRQLIQKNIEHFQEYHERRISLGKDDALLAFSSMWCTSFENSFLWIGGCRPTLSIQLVYTLCGMELENHLMEFLDGVRRGDLGELCNSQLSLVNDLHCRTVQEEEAISSRLAGLQEEVGDDALFEGIDELDQDGETNGFLRNHHVLEEHAQALSRIMEEADMCRLSTVKELTNILTPLQAVDFLVAAKKLYLSMHEWGQRKFIEHGKFCPDN